MSFTPRLTAPSTSNKCYYAGNPYYQSGYGLPNCTCYAWGRFYEILGEQPTLSLRDAENWYSHDDGYERGDSPQLGAVICWRRGAVGDDSDGAGHVAIVEQINDDGSILTSNSAYQGTKFYLQTLTPESGYNWNDLYTFQGFIYNPAVKEDKPLPEPISANRYLSQSEMENNALYFYYKMSENGWTMESIAAMLGNMQKESTINAGIWQNLDEGNTSLGYGLVQWTPATKYLNWCSERGLEPSDMDSAMQRLDWELANGVQWISTDSYPQSFEEFKHSTDDPYILAISFLLNYERPAEKYQPERSENAVAWYEFLQENAGSIEPDEPEPEPAKKKKGMSLLLMILATKRVK